jgi:hypothetical protein
MKKLFNSLICLLSLTISAHAFAKCQYSIQAYDIENNQNLKLCLDLTTELVRDGVAVYNSEGHGGAGVRRPIYAVEMSGNWFSERFIFSNESESEICKIVGKRTHVPGASLVYYGRKERMLFFNSTNNIWEIDYSKRFYQSVVTCQ